MSTFQQTRRGREHVVLVRYAHDRRWRRITITASDVYRGRSAETVVAAAESLFNTAAITAGSRVRDVIEAQGLGEEISK